MASGTLYLRPSADVVLGHKVYPDTLTEGYLAISEEVSDDTATYLQATYSSDTSTFVLSGAVPEKPFNIQSGNIYLAFTSPLQYGKVQVSLLAKLYIEGVEVGTFSDEANYDYFTSFSSNINDEIIRIINEHIATNKTFPNIQVSVKFWIKFESNESGKGGGSGDLTQMYISLSYDEVSGLPIHTKSNGTWVQAQKAYQKQNSTWVELTEDECKSIFQSSLIIKSEVS